jgi:hypothetical protein
VHIGNRVTVFSSHLSMMSDSKKRFDLVLKFLFAFEICCILAQIVVANVLNMIDPRNVIYMQIVFGIQGGFIWLMACSVIYQLQRIASVVASAEANPFINEALLRLRQQQSFFAVLMTFGVGMHLLLAFLVLELKAFTLLYYLFIEFCSSAFAAFAASRRGRKHKQPQVTAGEALVVGQTPKQ